jgi:Asp-tRNA(Asn)/Glu-tRNA(Gln) amidotransferase C subunit
MKFELSDERRRELDREFSQLQGLIEQLEALDLTGHDPILRPDHEPPRSDDDDRHGH